MHQVILDFIGLVKVCGILIGLKWIFMILVHFKDCIKTKNLQPADIALGEGPFKVRRGNTAAFLKSSNAISGIREIWVRDVYLKNDFLKIPADGLVVDLGANVGNFSTLALAHNNKIKVIAVEPNKELNKLFNAQIDLNGWSDRVILNRYFIGSLSAKQEMMFADPNIKDAAFITQHDFINLNQIKRVDFLKCDIEGSEFEFIAGETSLLNITSQLAIEVHDFAGNRYHFIDRLIELGFIIGPVKHDPEGCILLAKRI